jgi:hypothetical protein
LIQHIYRHCQQSAENVPFFGTGIHTVPPCPRIVTQICEVQVLNYTSETKKLNFLLITIIPLTNVALHVSLVGWRTFEQIKATQAIIPLMALRDVSTVEIF